MNARVPAPVPPPPRRTGRPLPPYRYVPGHTPHPFRHPDGHAWIGGEAPPMPRWAPGPWRQDAIWLWACDLFDHRYYWEAHEAWEGMWRQVGADAPLRPLLQGLILTSASLLKRAVGEPELAARLWARAQARLDDAGTGVVHGLDVDATRAVLAAEVASGWPRLPGPREIG